MRAPAPHAAALTLALALWSMPLSGQAGQPEGRAQGQFRQREPDFDRMLPRQAETDKAWRAASEGFMQMAKMTFDRRVDPKTWQPENTREQRDSWNRVWTFLDWNLDPFHGAAPASTK